DGMLKEPAVTADVKQRMAVEGQTVDSSAGRIDDAPSLHLTRTDRQRRKDLAADKDHVSLTPVQLIHLGHASPRFRKIDASIIPEPIIRQHENVYGKRRQRIVWIAHDDGAEEAHAHLIGRTMIRMGMIPVCTCRSRGYAEGVGEASPWFDGMERAAVGNERNMEPVPVDRGRLGQVITYMNDQAVPFRYFEKRPGNAAIVGEDIAYLPGKSSRWAVAATRSTSTMAAPGARSSSRGNPCVWMEGGSWPSTIALCAATSAIPRVQNAMNESERAVSAFGTSDCNGPLMRPCAGIRPHSATSIQSHARTQS